MKEKPPRDMLGFPVPDRDVEREARDREHDGLSAIGLLICWTVVIGKFFGVYFGWWQ